MKYFILILLATLSTMAVSQANNLYENLNKGLYEVGFKELQTYDYSRVRGCFF